MVKKVNIYAPLPIRTVTPMIYGRLNNVCMSPANILKCLVGRATVHEVLSDGSLLKLNEKNYNTVNTPVKEKVQPKIAGKQQSAIRPTDVKTKRIILKPEVKEEQHDKETAEKETPVEEAKEETVVEETIKVEETGTVEEQTNINETVKETKEAASEDEDPELAEIAAEIAKLEAEEAALKAKEAAEKE
jgi:hypothetical protein